MKGFLSLIFGMVLCSFSCANCSEFMAKISKDFHSKEQVGSYRVMSCKIWPFSPGKTLVVMALKSEDFLQDAGGQFYDIDIVIFNNENNDVIARFFEKNAFYDNSVYTEGVIIDTARYQLNSTTRAFGIRFHKTNFSKYNKGFEDVLNLYYLKDKMIHQVLRGLRIKESYSDWQEKCIGSFEDIIRTLSIEKEQQNGFNSLKISEVITNSLLKTIKHGGCDKIFKSAKKKSFFLKYNGSAYNVPKSYIGAGF